MIHYRLSSRSLPRISPWLSGLLLVSCATLAWSTAGLFTRIIPLDSWTLLLWRGVFGALAILAVVVAVEGKKTISQFSSLGVGGWMFVFVSAVGMVLFITALKHTTVAHVSIMYATVPLVTAGLAWLTLSEKPSRSAIIASLVALVGVGVMVGMASEGTIQGDLLALGMTVCMAAMMIINQRYPNVPILPAACLSALLSAAIALPFSNPFSVDASQWHWLMLFGVVNSALGLVLFIVGAKLLPAIETALITALDAPIAPIWVWVLFSEDPQVSTLIGGLIVFSAVAKYLVGSQIGKKNISV